MNCNSRPYTFVGKTVGAERGYPHYKVDDLPHTAQIYAAPNERVLTGSQALVERNVVRKTICNPWWHTRAQRRVGVRDGIRSR